MLPTESDETRVARAKNITPPDHITFDSIGGQERKSAHEND